MGGRTLAPFFVADPSADAQSRQTAPYHMYVRREDPQVIFGGIDAGVPNRARQDKVTLLDEIWSGAPFVDQRAFMAAVTRAAGAWQQAGLLSAQERAAVLDAAAKLA
jgi:hypothetical protein